MGAILGGIITVGDPVAEAAFKNGYLVMISDATLTKSSLVGYLK